MQHSFRPASCVRLRARRLISGLRIHRLRGSGTQDEQLRLGHGYDHNWVLNKTGAGMTLAAVVTDPKSGRSLEVRTTQPGVQFYTGNFMDGKPAAQGGSRYRATARGCVWRHNISPIRRISRRFRRRSCVRVRSMRRRRILAVRVVK